MEGHLGSDAQFLNRVDVAPGPVLGIRDEPRWSELATKEGAAQLVDEHLALGDIARCHEGVQDDARSATVVTAEKQVDTLPE